MKIPSSSIILVLAASVASAAGYRGASRPATRISGTSLRAPRRFSTPRSFTTRALPARPTFGRATFAPELRASRGFSRPLTSTPVTPGQPAGGAGAQTTGGNSAFGAFLGTSNNTLVESRGDARTMTTDGGGLISYHPVQRDYITNAPGAFVGTPDLPPGGNVTNRASGLNGIFPNSPSSN